MDVNEYEEVDDWIEERERDREDEEDRENDYTLSLTSDPRDSQRRRSILHFSSTMACFLLFV